VNLDPAKLKHWAKLLTTFLFGQGGNQLLQLVTGFVLINWLSKGDYATYTMVIAIQSAAAVLVDMGVTQPLTSLIGGKSEDRAHVGRYITASRYFRDRLLLIGCVLLLPVFFLASGKGEWSWSLCLLLWLWVALSLVFRSWTSIYSSVLLLQQKLRAMYAYTLAGGAFRLAAIAACHALGFLTAQWAILFGAVQAFIAGWGVRRLALPKLLRPPAGSALKQEKKEILEFALPRAPSLVYFSFEGQITVFLIAIFGSTAGIAEVGALGRLGMLFLIFNRMSLEIVNPYFARIEPARVLPRFLFVFLASCSLLLLASASSFFFPQAYLWILGDGYQHLEYAVFLVMTAGGVHLVTRMTFAVILARKYIYRWFALADILPDLLVLAVCTAIFDLSDIHGVLYLGLTMAVGKLVVKIAMLVYGLRRERRIRAA